MLKVLTWLWHQPGVRFSYEPWHVRIWAAMIRRHLTIPHTLAVVTDIDGDYGHGVEVIRPPRDFEAARIPTWGSTRPQCLRRLSMFRRDAADLFGADRIVCTDLDLVVRDSLDPLLDIKDDFKITRGTARSRAYNGSMISLRLGSRPKVFEKFTLDRAIEAGRRHVGSDQAWIAAALPGEKTWSMEDGVFFWAMQHSIHNARVVFFAGGMKPWTLASVGRETTVARHYRGERRERCLVLGYGETLWDDVAAAFVKSPYAAVIASPEAAAHWPGPVLAVADDDAHAERLAAMHGFADVVFCGRSGGQLNAAP